MTASDDWRPGRRREPPITRRLREWYLWWVTENVLYGFERFHEKDQAELEVYVVEWYVARFHDYVKWNASDVYRGGAYPSAEWVPDKKAFWQDFPRAVAAARRQYVAEQRARVSGQPCPDGPIDIDAALAAALASSTVREPAGHFFLTNPRDYLRHLTQLARRRRRAAGLNPDGPIEKRCFKCDAAFDAPHPAVRACHTCRNAPVRTCVDCEQDFTPTGRAKRCPTCREKKGAPAKRQPRHEA